MDKRKLNEILAAPFSQEKWAEVLYTVFGVRRLHQQPQPIAVDAKKADAAYELGSFNTSDDRIIGLYLVQVKPEVWLERNKVGLRELLRSIYKYDVDGALVVFAQGDKWRLSFISEIRVLDAEGKISTKATEPRRYTYLLGRGEKTKTPSTRLATLVGKPIVLEDIRTAFGVEALNEEFYKAIAEYFYQLVGATSTKGKQKVIHERVLKLPDRSGEDLTPFKEFAVRLIGRTVFCWFLKVKKSDAGKALLPEQLLSSDAVRAHSGYYHAILERLFFQTLNTPIAKRVQDLPAGCEDVPFLNGGLFEPHSDDHYQPDSVTGLSKFTNTLVIPDAWFLGLFEMLEQFNFTIDENSTLDIEVSVDPEMLGRIFENLLAEIDPDSGETARKATGSFYTPREIVDYMATESLVYHLQRKSGLFLEEIRPVFKIDTALSLDTAQKTKLLEGLADLKVLDPACGSGAFPMGVLQKIVQALQKLDPKAVWWKAKQLEGIGNALIRKEVQKKLDAASWEYVRKLGIIQNSLYGVDIQPIAAEISKLRCFLTLIVDETIDDTAPNRGIEPLPNLEFKFVTADAVRQLPEEKDFGGLFNFNAELEELQKLRLEYLQSYGEEKLAIKDQYKVVQKDISLRQLDGTNTTESRAFKISNWNPFGHGKVDWFDPLWMFGVAKFDVVIGNPPYLRLQGIQATNPGFVQYAKKTYKSASKGNWDMYVLFNERGYELLDEGGILSYIQPHKFFQADFGVGIRDYLGKEQALLKIVHFGAEQIFNSATNYTCLFFLQKSPKQAFEFYDASSPTAWQQLVWTPQPVMQKMPRGDAKWQFSDAKTEKVLNLLKRQLHTLSDVTRKIFVGLQTSADKIYALRIISEGNHTYQAYSEELECELEIEKGFVEPFLMGKDVKRYSPPIAEHLVVFPYRIQNEKAELMTAEYIQQLYPMGWDYLLKNQAKLESRENGKYAATWWQFGRPQNMGEFGTQKLITPDIAGRCEYTYDKESHYHTTSVYSLVFENGNKERPEFWLGILNSSIHWYFLQATGNVQRGGFFRFKTNYLRPFPVPRIDFGSIPSPKTHDAIVALVNATLAIRAMKSQLHASIPNLHIAKQLEEVIDALVMELYFKPEFAHAGIEITYFVIRDWEVDIDSTDEELSYGILQFIERLGQRDNEIRQGLKLMDVRLAEIVMPIKNALQ